MLGNVVRFRTCSMLAVTLVMAACSGGSGDGTTASGDAAGATARGVIAASSASLQGTPETTATTGTAYRFAPSLTDANGTFTFAIQNKPAWAQFSPATGELSGTPTATDLGTTEGIVITASNGRTSLELAPFAITVATPPVQTASVTLSWLPPAAYTDGSPLGSLAGYVIYHGTSADNLRPAARIDDPSQTAFTMQQLLSGAHFFGISAYTIAGVESAMSAIGSIQLL